MATHISTPEHVTYSPLKKTHQTEVTIAPCFPGYGTTIGNALRRVLLSSLPGSAVSAVKIQGIQHEYDTLEHVKEDVVEIIMNLKKLRVKSHSAEPVTLTLSAKGEKEVTAADIKKDSSVDVVSKDLVIATLTDKKAEFTMEITVKQGIGYEPVEERVVDKKDIGTIQIDSIFSPVLNVGFKVEHVRVGQRTDFEKIVLMLTTDGTVEPEAAISTSVEILQEQFNAIRTAATGSGKEDADEMVLETPDAEKAHEE